MDVCSAFCRIIPSMQVHFENSRSFGWLESEAQSAELELVYVFVENAWGLYFGDFLSTVNSV